MAQYSNIATISEQIHRQLDGGDISLESKFDQREIQILVEQEANTQIQQRIIEEWKEEGEINVSGAVIVPFSGILIRRDAVREITYAIIPVKYIQLPLNRGVYLVTADSNENGESFGPFVPVQPGGEAFFGIRKAPPMQGRVSYKVEQDRIVFFEDIRMTRGIQSCTIKIVVASADSVYLTISPDMERIIIQNVLALIQARSNPDMINDGSPVKALPMRRPEQNPYN